MLNKQKKQSYKNNELKRCRYIATSVSTGSVSCALLHPDPQGWGSMSPCDLCCIPGLHTAVDQQVRVSCILVCPLAGIPSCSFCSILRVTASQIARSTVGSWSLNFEEAGPQLICMLAKFSVLEILTPTILCYPGQYRGRSTAGTMGQGSQVEVCTGWYTGCA